MAISFQDRSRERRACDAVARCLEGIAGHQRIGAHCPEDLAKGQSAVDYAFDLVGLSYAFEHTVVEAFDGQLRTDEHFGRFVERIEAALDHQMPSNGYFVLLFPTDPSNGMKPKAIARKQAEIIAWARAAALELSKAAQLTSRQLWQSPPSRDMPNNDITLSFREDINGDIGGRLLAQRKAPKNYEQLRISRVRQALDGKLPKLAKCRPVRTVLVLENRDMALSNHWAISESLEKALLGRPDIPDEVWLVDAAHQAFWISICIRKDGMLFPYDGESVRFREFEPAQLSAA
jgi:hypothetical protein